MFTLGVADSIYRRLVLSTLSSYLTNVLSSHAKSDASTNHTRSDKLRLKTSNERTS